MRAATRMYAVHCGAMDDKSRLALVQLGVYLRRDSYTFVTPTPATHRRVLGRGKEARTITDIFGWNLPFDFQALPTKYVDLLAAAGALEVQDKLGRSGVRFSSLDRLLLVHSAFPTGAEDSVFFGPDTYRFAREIRALFGRHPEFRPRRVLDIGAGTGAGGFVCEQLCPTSTVSLLDINHKALRYCEVNAAINRREARSFASDVLDGVDGMADLIVSNPPYLNDAAGRTYRHGGGEWGADLSVRILIESLERLSPGGKLLLYTGSAIVDGVDTFFEAVRDLPPRMGRSFRYCEVDPDVFGEELEAPPYDRSDRIAAVCLTIE